jgi:hypothetical protein
MAPYQPPHGGAPSLDASILSIYLLSHLGHFNSFSSLGPRGTGTSKLDLHRRQVSSQVIMISFLFFRGMIVNPDAMSDFCTDKNSVLDKLNIQTMDFYVKKKGLPKFRFRTYPQITFSPLVKGGEGGFKVSTLGKSP